VKVSEYLIAIYKGNPEGNDERAIKSIATSMGISIRFFYISSANISLVLAKERLQLTIGHTDEYFLLTQALQRLQDNNKFYYVYDYRSRKEYERSKQNCYSLMQLKTTVTKLQTVIQMVKDVKYKVFAGFEFISIENTNFLLIDILLSSELLSDFDKNILTESELQEYQYLQSLYEVLSSSNIAEIVTCSLSTLSKEKYNIFHN
jgi:hypothetical protein